MKNNKAILIVMAAVLCSLVPVAGRAASGTVEVVLSSTLNVYAVQMGESTVTATGGKGMLTFAHSTGRPFVDGASATVELASFSKTTPSGLELEADGLATFSPEDTLLLLFERRSDDLGTSDEGNLSLAGGTGQFAGVTGQCRYKMGNGADDANLTTANCQWVYQFPYR